MLGKIVEAVSGQPLDRFLAEKIFKPLGMTETGFFVPAGSESRVQSLYTVAVGKASQREPLGAWSGTFGVPPKMLWGGHGLASTAADYIRFAQMIANKGELDGVRLLNAATAEMMTRAEVAPDLPLRS